MKGGGVRHAREHIHGSKYGGLAVSYVARVSSTPSQTAALEALRREVSDRAWYHTIELAPGITTPGWFDLRGLAPSVPLPLSLAGKRCLDVGTFDGFWAFLMESRGASEVVAVDVLDPRRWDWPAGSTDDVIAAVGARKGRGEGFEIARRALGSRVNRHEASIYELDPASIGTFDVVYLGSLLLHLRDPIGGLMRIREVCRGLLVLVDAIDLPRTLAMPRTPIARLDATGRPWWWKPNQAGLVRMVEAAGLELAGAPRRIRMSPGAGHPPRPRNPRALLSAAGRDQLLEGWVGDPHCVITARPAPTN
jgi:tRNA (mo5U34)-methyltransferase